ncbi:acetyl-CoA carboxylase biotin carboxyl carrier protein subunit [Halalkalibacter oceani]|uniref:Acetyl-CoA carboxylase biotin carboxyl carrier protein subunit n=1 Tax=Halalkalibacter oceani TaxID=1653776 RepID=A0A9X2DP86_9BACI|nr:acetyl-CoA carboxylase biotin carboxyl carrier protein subunit [Halalkalibacter oceani]MCM3712603.1 acetyl-CoA carboxylase biotin carboxyl carrier protein subunit [Halalkalibacter oceani]
MAEIKAMMAGNVWKIIVQVGDEVTVGQQVAILESMKMEISIEAASSGTVTAILKEEGEFVNEGDVLMEMT